MGRKGYSANPRKSLHKTKVNKWDDNKLTQEAKLKGYRSRSAFKLLEIDSHINFSKKRIRTTIDLGAAPGGWTQIRTHQASQKSAVQAAILAVDLQPITSFSNIPENVAITVMQHDVMALDFPAHCRTWLSEYEQEYTDLLLSDMAPNMTGITEVDTEALWELNNSTLNISEGLLSKSGTLIFKTFANENLIALQSRCKKMFSHCKVVKLHSSRKTSKEVFICGMRD